MNEEQLQKVVMRKVYVAYVMRRLSEFPIGELFALACLGCLSLLFVSFRHVFTNALGLHGLNAMSGFFESAFMSTEFAVKLIIITGLIIVTRRVWNACQWCVKQVYHIGMHIVGGLRSVTRAA